MSRVPSEVLRDNYTMLSQRPKIGHVILHLQSGSTVGNIFSLVMRGRTQPQKLNFTQGLLETVSLK